MTNFKGIGIWIVTEACDRIDKTTTSDKFVFKIRTNPGAKVIYQKLTLKYFGWKVDDSF